MNEWKEVELGDLVHIKHGWAFKGKYFAEDGDVIVVTPGNFLEEGGFRVREGKEKFYTDDFPKEFLLKKDDLIIAMTEQGAGLLGSPALITEDNRFLHNQRIGLFQNLKEDQISKKYMYYLFFTQYIRGMISGSATGTKVKHTAPKRIYNIKVKLPPLLIQKKIAKILSNYDDLIENNLKRIKLLEESARLTYEEWFLRFRIDGEKLEIDSGTGLPFGWKEIRLKNLIKFYNGKACTIGQSDGKYPVYGSNGKVGKLDQFKYENVIIIGRVGAYCGTVFYVKEKCWATDNTIIVKPNKNDIFFLYYSLDTYNLNNYAGGSAQPLLTQGWLKPLKIKYPKEELITKFDKLVEPMFREMKTLDNQNQLLKEARDILLPRLMTGMINVDELEVAV